MMVAPVLFSNRVPVPSSPEGVTLHDLCHSCNETMSNLFTLDSLARTAFYRRPRSFALALLFNLLVAFDRQSVPVVAKQCQTVVTGVACAYLFCECVSVAHEFVRLFAVPLSVEPSRLNWR